MMNRESIKSSIIEWNNRFPIDRWWRKKYNIAFNSSTHRESSFLDQLLDYEEDKLFEEFFNKEKYVPNSGDWIKKPDLTKVNISDSIQSLRDEFKDIIEDGE